MIQDIAAAFEAVESDHLEFERIENPPSKRRDLCAFLYLDTMFPDEAQVLANASHDEVCLDVNAEKFAEKATKADVLYLTRCGVHYNEEYEYLALFV